MYPTIIKCPNCGSLYKLQKNHSKTFFCPRCHHSAPFKEIMNSDGSPKTKIEGAETVSAQNPTEEKTRVVNFGDKTRLVPGLQRPSEKNAMFQVIFKGVNIGNVALPKSGNFNLGRRSSDSRAQIKIAPDMTMSRLHAAMRVMKGKDGGPEYQITTVKEENPAYVNGVAIGRGKICTLKTGDKVQLGDTVMIFKLV